MKNLFSFLILVLFVHIITGDSSNITEQKEIALRPRLENNFGETPSETVITTAITEGDEIFDDNEVQKMFAQHFKLTVIEEIERKKNETSEMKQQRTSRDVVNKNHNLGTVCLLCYAKGFSTSDDDCYKGTNLKKQQCSNAEICYTELHQNYIKRGCIVPWSVNRTFVCKCPLCNDKPADDTTYYEYRKISEWEYDNKRLQKSNAGMDLLCKVCETKGTNVESDNICKVGKNAEYMLCGRNQICYTNIDNQMDFVSRGCIDRPIYNSIYFFCNKTTCNYDNFYTQKIKPPGIIFRSLIPLARRVSSSQAAKSGFCNKFIVLILFFTI